MRFKIYFNEAQNKIDVNCLKDEHCDVIIPENLDQHLHYPIPNNLDQEIREYIVKDIDQEYSQMFIDLMNDARELQTRRKNLMQEIRTKYNPLIIEKCNSFKEEHAEHFI